MMIPNLASFMVIILVHNTPTSLAVDCGINDRNTRCLDVYASEPATLPKCYCTELCEYSLEYLKQNCLSGELHQDGCGACLTCAKALGETCGGQFNVLGSCAGGLTCLIEIPPNTSRRISERRKVENARSGTCVSDRSSECPTASVSASAFTGRKLCRPGRRGIIAEALYCPKQVENTQCVPVQGLKKDQVQEKVQGPAFPSLFSVLSGTANNVAGGIGSIVDDRG